MPLHDPDPARRSWPGHTGHSVLAEEQVFAQCLALVRREGKIIFQGYYPDPIVIDFHPTNAKRVAIVFPPSYDGIASAIGTLATGSLQVKPLITRRLL